MRNSPPVCESSIRRMSEDNTLTKRNLKRRGSEGSIGQALNDRPSFDQPSFDRPSPSPRKMTRRGSESWRFLRKTWDHARSSLEKEASLERSPGQRKRRLSIGVADQAGVNAAMAEQAAEAVRIARVARIARVRRIYSIARRNLKTSVTFQKLREPGNRFTETKDLPSGFDKGSEDLLSLSENYQHSITSAFLKFRKVASVVASAAKLAIEEIPLQPESSIEDSSAAGSDEKSTAPCDKENEESDVATGNGTENCDSMRQAVKELTRQMTDIFAEASVSVSTEIKACLQNIVSMFHQSAQVMANIHERSMNNLSELQRFSGELGELLTTMERLCRCAGYDETKMQDVLQNFENQKMKLAALVNSPDRSIKDELQVQDATLEPLQQTILSKACEISGPASQAQHERVQKASRPWTHKASFSLPASPEPSRPDSSLMVMASGPDRILHDDVSSFGSCSSSRIGSPCPALRNQDESHCVETEMPAPECDVVEYPQGGRAPAPAPTSQPVTQILEGRSESPSSDFWKCSVDFSTISIKPPLRRSRKSSSSGSSNSLENVKAPAPCSSELQTSVAPKRVLITKGSSTYVDVRVVAGEVNESNVQMKPSEQVVTEPPQLLKSELQNSTATSAGPAGRPEACISSETPACPHPNSPAPPGVPSWSSLKFGIARKTINTSRSHPVSGTTNKSPFTLDTKSLEAVLEQRRQLSTAVRAQAVGMDFPEAGIDLPEPEQEQGWRPWCRPCPFGGPSIQRSQKREGSSLVRRTCNEHAGHRKVSATSISESPGQSMRSLPSVTTTSATRTRQAQTPRGAKCRTLPILPLVSVEDQSLPRHVACVQTARPYAQWQEFQS